MSEIAAKETIANFTHVAFRNCVGNGVEAFLRAGDDGGTDEQIAQIPEPFRLHATITASIRFELNAAPARQNVHA